MISDDTFHKPSEVFAIETVNVIPATAIFLQIRDWFAAPKIDR